MAIIKNEKNNKRGQGCGEKEPYTPLVGVHIRTATEEQYESSLKT
jgi:hypothetical protein